MTKYVAFLKQVYFRKKFIKMAELKNFFIDIGFQNVETVFTSGNVIFNSQENFTCLHEFISNELKKHYEYNIDVFLKTENDIKSIIKNNPYELKNNYYIQTFICYNNFEKTLYNEFSKVNLIENEEFQLNNNFLYWTYYKPTRFKSNILKITSRESLKHDFTLRTIGTLKKLNFSDTACQ